MQTFLPYSSFDRSAAALDLRRLGKQRVETLQILRALTFEDYGWRNHPAVTMWAGYTNALVAYGVAVTRQWQKAGFGDTVLPQLLEFLDFGPLRTQRELAGAGELPPWLGKRSLHRSHQAALLRKDPDHYGPLFRNVDPQLPYVWPEVERSEVPPGTVTAWVVRAAPDEVSTLVQCAFAGIRPLADEGPDLPVGAGTRNTKRRRQVSAFVGEIDPGQLLVVPAGDMLHVAEVAGEYQWRPDAPHGLAHTRPVRWLTEIRRSDLRRPVYLQDPRIVFPLRDEPALGR